MNKLENREIRTIKTINAPIDKVWLAWSKPEHIANWWGPIGFTNTIDKMDFKKGGDWEFTMHGPDKTNYPNKSTFCEIIPLKKIVFEHFNPHFIATITFESKGKQTLIDWRGLFDTPEIRNALIKTFKADEGQKQNIEKLEKYLSTF